MTAHLRAFGSVRSVFPYWLLFGIFALGAIGEKPFSHWQRSNRDLGLLLAVTILALFIGLRFEVGGDWGAYIRLFVRFEYWDLERALSVGDPGYHLLYVLAHWLGAGMWFVNLICGVIFTWGLYRFSLTQPSPWLVFLVAVPYLVIVVAMGYTRQGVAIGILMAGLARFQFNGSVVRFAIYVAIAALFHRTAVVALPLVAMGGQRSLTINLLLVGFGSVALYDIMVAPAIDSLVEHYVREDMGSKGAMVRVLMSVVPAVLYLMIGPRMNFTPGEAGVWRNFSYASLIALVALWFMTSTVVDRLALYLLPLQLAVIPRLSGVLGSETGGKFMVIGYAAMIEFTWLNFGDYAPYWLPYHFYPLAGWVG